MQFESGHLDSQLPVTAKWEHIGKLYKCDKPFMIHSLYKLTDTHLAPVTQCAMKVSLAAEVMSHTVAAGIYSLVCYGKEQRLHSFCFHKKVTCSNVTWYLVLNIFFKLTNCDNETSVELLMCLCFCRGVQQRVLACGCVC